MVAQRCTSGRRPEPGRRLVRGACELLRGIRAPKRGVCDPVPVADAPEEVAVNPSRTLDRRTFVVDLGRGGLALAVLGIAGCAPAATGSAVPSQEHRHERRLLAGRLTKRQRRGLDINRRKRERKRRGRRSGLEPRQPRLRLGLHPRPWWRGGDRGHGRGRQRRRDRGGADRDRPRLAGGRARDPDPQPRRPRGQRRGRPGPRRRRDGVRRRRGHRRDHRPARADPCPGRRHACSTSRSSRPRATPPAASPSSILRRAGSSSWATRWARAAVRRHSRARSSPRTWSRPRPRS